MRLPSGLAGSRGLLRDQGDGIGLQLLGQDEQVQRVLEAEQTRLKREVARLEEENAFLKKAAAYFAKQPK